MDKETQVLEMAKILCPKGTANCEKCSKNYKCDVKFSQLAELCDGGCQIVGKDEVVIKKQQYEQLKKYNRDRKRLRLRWQQSKQETVKDIIDKIENLADIEIREDMACEKYFDMVLDLLDKELED